jgi:1-deoxy-D-xylulose-5-phosphate reductoisomerase
MRLPIAYAFAYPERWDGMLPALDVVRMGRLDFGPPDVGRFPCLALAYDALRHGGAAPVVLNAANEIAVQAFLDRRIPFPAIPRVIAAALDWGAPLAEPANLEQIREIDARTRTVSADTIDRIPSS